MGKSFAKIAFTPLVKEQQNRHGSRPMYARVEQAGPPGDRLSSHERDLILTRDSFYMASIGETGWPYIQHRGGPPGFLHILDDQTIAFADFRGNKQYISIGNLQHDDRVALFLMDYPSRSRLKILGHAAIYEGTEAAALIEQLSSPAVESPIERAIVIKVDAFDWNCPQNITPRYTEKEIIHFTTPIRQRIADLEAENKRLRVQLNQPAKP
ncbi:MAG: Flavodoxin reductase (ferredoxin-NADPH reductase) family 1 [Edaphobacter sp.]|nr:Flavodoxin reductase (ferredoxin-NADPH reductase) family 1 [Edaphobacter sp.]